MPVKGTVTVLKTVPGTNRFVVQCADDIADRPYVERGPGTVAGGEGEFVVTIRGLALLGLDYRVKMPDRACAT